MKNLIRFAIAALALAGVSHGMKAKAGYPLRDE